MELEFDKEIDALLRRAQRASPVASEAHLDADELSAFAENALPGRTQQMYVMHLADCDRCRKILSSFIATAPEKAAAAAASAPAQEAIIKATLPWYQRIFRLPNLAYAMGTLVILFSGIIGLLVYQNRVAQSGNQVSQITESRPAAAPQSMEEREQAVVSSNSSANTNANAATSSPIESVTKSGVAVGSSNMAAAPPADEKSMTLDGVSANQPVVTSPAPKPAAESVDVTSADKASREANKNKDDLAKTENKVLKEDEQRNRSVETQNTMRDMAPGAQSAKRAEGPRQVQGQTTQRQINELPVGGRNAASLLSSIRTADGKKFELRDGIWYDTSYTGQRKKDFKRGTEKYIRLDAGLRGIADQIGGTVVIVWNGQAYKIK